MMTLFCHNCGPGEALGDGEEPIELIWTEGDQALCVLCAIEIVECECGGAVRRLEIQFTATGDLCPACAWSGPSYTERLAA